MKHMESAKIHREAFSQHLIKYHTCVKAVKERAEMERASTEQRKLWATAEVTQTTSMSTTSISTTVALSVSWYR